MDPLSVTASIISILQLSAKVLAYLNDVKDASKDRAQCAIEASNLHSILLNLRFRLEDGGSNQPWYTAVRSLAVENGPLDQFKQALETLQIGIGGGVGRLKKAGEALRWKFKKEEVIDILARMERLKLLVEIALQMDHFKLSQAIKEDTNIFRTHIPSIQSGVDRIRQDQDYEQHRTVIDWISPTNYPAQQSDIIKRRQKGTGQWFLDSPEVARWLREPESTLFCPGIPGAGKTMIAAIAIDHLSAQRSLCGVAYVYCNYKDQEGKDSSSMLAAILKQLVQARPSVMHLIEPWHQQHTNEGTNPSLDEIVNKLKDVLTYCRTNYIVIDALDECRDSDGTRRQFLTKLQDLRAGRDLRLMVTSRVIPEVVDEFRHAIWLEVQANEEDIKLFITGQTYRLPGCIQRSPTLQNMVQDKIVEAADGMFLLASLHTDSLLDKRTTKDVKSTLATLSKGSKALEGAYRDALYRIKGQLGGDYELAKSVLSWITSAKRPLTTAELCYALAVEVDETEIDPENIHDAEDFVSVCAGLVVIDQESTIIRLVHYTTQEYFESIRDTWNPVIQQQIATACLAYLSFDTFRSGPSSTDEELEERLQQHKFLDYAANHWGEHAREVEPEISDLACSFLLRSGSLLSASQVSSSSRLKNLNYSQSYVRITALQCAAQFGLFRVTQKLLPKSKKEAFEAVNTMDSWDRTPLELAAENGHHKVAMLLIEKGAHVNGEVGESCNGLQEASYRGHDQVVKLLLDKGANANAEGIHYYKGESCYNALQAASLGGHEQVVKLLLNKGANVNAEGGFYGNALQAASYEGHEHIVELLLSSGASVNMQGGTYINALKAASFGGHEQVVKLLLDRGASINMKDSPFDNALQEASYRGHEHIVKLLLDRGADINAGGRNSGNALYVASSGGHEHIVKLLLDRGANICAEGGYHGTALQAASYAGYKHIVELLLDRGVNIHAEGGEYANALQAASCGGYEHIVKLLLDRGANINTEGGFFGNALQAASCRGHEHIVKLLLDRGANINAEGGIYDNALQAALIGGYGHIVKLLLEKGANAKVGGGKYGIVY